MFERTISGSTIEAAARATSKVPDITPDRWLGEADDQN